MASYMLRLHLQQIQDERLVKLIILVVYRMRWFFTTKPSEQGRGRTGGARGLIFALCTWTLRTDNGLLCSLSHQPPPPIVFLFHHHHLRTSLIKCTSIAMTLKASQLCLKVAGITMEHLMVVAESLK